MQEIAQSLAEASALLVAGRLPEAEEIFRQILLIDPDHVEAMQLLGIVEHQTGQHADAAATFRQTLRIAPDSADAANNLGTALWRLGKLAEAAVAYRRAVELRPDAAEMHHNLVGALLAAARWDEAEAACRRVLELNPDSAEAHDGLGTALKEQGKLAEAARAYDRALEIAPAFAQAHWNRGLLCLLTGDFDRGWREFQWRWHIASPQFAPPNLARPSWNGEPLGGRTILIHCESAVGDSLQFIRYAELVAERGGWVVVGCPASLERLMASCPGVERTVVNGATLPVFDAHVPLMSLPGIFGTTLETIPAKVPYLHAPQDRVEHWRQRLSAEPEFKIGAVWSGNPLGRDNKVRSFPVNCLAEIAQVPGVQLYSLQQGAGREQLREASFPLIDLADQLNGLPDTAAALANLDLVISCDSPSAHLAGAIGAPVWVPLSFVPDWRWLLDREDSPWYPTMRLFRQPEPGDWQSVFRALEAALRQRNGSSTP